MKKTTRVTRGFGLLEKPLARLRAQLADKLIPSTLRTGRILDIGCGSYPYFLSHTAFKSKFAIEQQDSSIEVPGINWLHLDLNAAPKIPFPDAYFDIITLLAVIEHMDPDSVVLLFKECHRALRTGGRLIITTPSPWASQLLKFMAQLYLVSKEEIQEHEYSYSHPLIAWYFGKSNFERTNISLGYFEFFLNIFAYAIK